jgi:hypothetical protein
VWYVLVDFIEQSGRDQPASLSSVSFARPKRWVLHPPFEYGTDVGLKILSFLGGMVAFDNLMHRMARESSFSGFFLRPTCIWNFRNAHLWIWLSFLAQKAPFGCHVTRVCAPSPACHWHHSRCSGYLHMRSVQHPVTPPWSGQRPSACASAYCHAMWMRMYRSTCAVPGLGCSSHTSCEHISARTLVTEHEPLGTAKSAPLNVTPEPARFQSSASSCPDLHWTRPGHVEGRYQSAAYAK